MQELSDYAEEEIRKLETTIEYVKKEIKRAPEGSLSWSNNRGKPYYYKYIEGERKYIPAKKREQAAMLAQKDYYNELLTSLENELQVLMNLSEEYDPGAKFEVYHKMHLFRQQLVRPIIRSPKMKVEDWKAIKHETYLEHPEQLILDTERGEIVRSKSERDIANALFRKKDKLLYKYEPTLILEDPFTHEQIETHPDFEIIILATGEIFYWEHAGLMDEQEYARSFARKCRLYENNDIVLGRNLIITFETKNCPLSQKSIRNQIENMLR